MTLQNLLPLGAWLLLILVTVFVAWAFYALTSRLGRSVAWLQGGIGALTVKFGGPAALFFALVWLGRGYIPEKARQEPARVTLTGKVIDVNDQAVRGANIVSTHCSTITKRDGTFALTVPQSDNSEYAVIAHKNGDFAHRLISGDETDKVEIPNFPDPVFTILTGQKLLDRDGQPVGPVRVFVESIVVPQGRKYGPNYVPGDSITIKIERHNYSIVLKDEKNNELGRKSISNLISGLKRPLPDVFETKGDPP